MNRYRSESSGRGAVVASLCVLMTAGQACAVDLEHTVVVHIPAQKLSSALVEFGRQTGLQVMTASSAIGELQSQGAEGKLSVKDALSSLLRGTNLQYQDAGANSVAVAPVFKISQSGTRADTAQQSTSAKSAPVGETIEKVIVTGTTIDDPILSSRTGDTLRERPQSVSIVTRERLEEQNLHTLGEAVQQATGVTTTSFSAVSTYFYSRGFQVNNVQIDGGAPVVLNNFGYLTSADMDIFEQVEVTRGADALFSGNGDPGGTIQLVRKRPTATPQISFAASAGRWNNYRGSLDASGPLGFDGRLRGRVVYMVEDGNAFYDNSAKRQSLIYGVLEAEVADGTLLTFGGVYDDARNQFAGYGLPRYTDGRDLRLPRSASLSPDWARNDNVDSDLFARLEQRLGDSWNVRVNVTRSKHDSNTNVLYPTDGVDPDTGLITSLYGFRNPHFRGTEDLVDATLRGSFEMFGRPQKIFLGVDWQKIRSRGNEFGMSELPASIDPFNFDPASIDEPYRSAIPDDRFVWGQEQSGVFLSANLNLIGTLHLLGGARYSNYEYLFDQDGFDPATGETIWEYTQTYEDRGVVTPFLGLTYELDSGWTVYGSWAESYKSQANSLQGPPPGTPLDPLTGTSVELGMKGGLWQGRAATQLAVYRIQRRNEAIQDPLYPDQGGPNGSNCCYFGNGVIESRGFDGEINGNLLEQWKLFLGYTYNENEYKSGFSEGRGTRSMPQTPKHLFKLWTTYDFSGALSRWKLGAGVNAQSEIFASGTVATRDPETGEVNGSAPYRFAQGGYLIANARVEYRIDDTWSASLNVDNLFDKVYYQSIGNITFYNFYGQPRSWLLSLRGRW